jgi:uncharacterized protein YbjT (DUF2867 family)
MSDITTRPVLVAGATGRQGGSVLRHLIERQIPVRALIRSSDGARAQELAGRGAETAVGDMDDPRSLTRAMTGVRGVYSMQDYWSVGAEREVQQGKNMADAAVEAGVEHFVYSSVGGAERDSRIGHFVTKWAIEQHIRARRLPATILRPVSFMNNYYIPAVEKALLKGKLRDPVRADVPYQTIAPDDIGKFAALAFAWPEQFTGLALEIAGSELTNRQAAGVFGRVLGRPVRFRRIPMPVARAMGKEFYQMTRWFNAGGYQADIAGLRRDYPEIHLTSLEEWLRSEGWENKKAIAVKRDRIGRPLPAS